MCAGQKTRLRRRHLRLSFRSLSRWPLPPSLPLSHLSLSRLMAASRLKTKPIPNQSKANQKPNLSHDCRQSVFVSYIDYVSLLLLLLLYVIAAAFRLFYVDAPHIYAVLQSPHQLIRYSSSYPSSICPSTCRSRCCFACFFFCFLGFLFPPPTVCVLVCACVCVLGA